MANKKTPGRDAFRKELETFAADLPWAYAGRTLEKLKKPLKSHLTMTYVNNVRKGHTVDWEVLEALKEVAAEVKKSTLQPA